MQPVADASEEQRDEAVAFIAELIRLQRQVADLAHEVDRVEFEMRQVLSQFDSKRFEEYR